MKASKIRRKQLNALRAQSDVPWPARKYRVTPIFSRGATKAFHIGTCERPIGEAQVKRGRLRRKQTVTVPCGGRLVARLGRSRGRRVYCESCRERKKQAGNARRLEQRMTKIGILTPREEARQSRRARFVSKLRRSGAR